MDQPLVSVIIPFYNAERYLGEAIESVLAQSYLPSQVILVDDGSIDRGSNIARSLSEANPNVQLLVRPENAGPAAARNAGLAHADGEFITYLDADDRMTPDRLTLQVQYLLDHPSVDVVIGAEQPVIETDAPADVVSRQQLHALETSFLLISMMLRRSALERVSGFDSSYRVAEDIDWLFRAADAGLTIEKIDSVMTLRRFHAGNLSNRTKDIRAAIVRSLRSRLNEREK